VVDLPYKVAARVMLTGLKAVDLKEHIYFLCPHYIEEVGLLMTKKNPEDLFELHLVGVVANFPDRSYEHTLVVLFLYHQRSFPHCKSSRFVALHF